jgi:hypothetical protein
MKRFIMFVICLSASTGIVGQSRSNSPRPDARRVVQMPRTPLIQLVRPGEEDLTVVRSADPPLEVGPPKDTAMSTWLTTRAAGVVVAQIIQVSPEMTRNADWINSTVEASIIDVIKTSAQWAPKHGDTFSFGQDGGIAVIAGTRVHAVVPWARPFETGKQYLLFVQVDPSNNSVVVSPGFAYDIGGTRPVRLADHVRARDDIESTNSVQALNRVREAARPSPVH